MKIGCPNCGQHYDIDAGAIDRFYRCTECGEVFQGITAKTVKARRYRRKSKSVDNSSSSVRPGSETATVPVLKIDGGERSSETRELSAEAAVAVPVENTPEPAENGSRRFLLMQAAVFLLLAVVLAVLIWQSVRVTRLERENRKLSTRVERLSGELESFKAADGK